MADPRMPPLPADERDERTSELLQGLMGGGDMNIFTTLARHPKLLKRWAAFGGTLLAGGDLPGREREILVLRTGANCGSDYEWGQHVRIGKDAGLTDDEIHRIYDGPDAGWGDDDRALIVAADELHNDSRISDGTWAALRGRYTDKQLIELLMVVGQYHLVSFTLNSLGVQREPGVEGFPA
ncbi:MAG: 4-carboxymuconolactone decarboxylase [Actinomycetota bacterium]|jgi:alkylhydroperoxidase family enzyme